MRAFKLFLISAVVGFCMLPASRGGGGSAAAAAAEVQVVVDPPVFFPRDDFPYEGGYYRTREGHYYHYDRDRGGWHYGRNHEEGLRYERGREHRR